LQIIDKKTAPPPKYYFSCARAGNLQGLETSKFCYIFWNKKKPKIDRNIDKF